MTWGSSVIEKVMVVAFGLFGMPMIVVYVVTQIANIIVFIFIKPEKRPIWYRGVEAPLLREMREVLMEEKNRTANAIMHTYMLLSFWFSVIYSIEWILK